MYPNVTYFWRNIAMTDNNLVPNSKLKQKANFKAGNPNHQCRSSTRRVKFECHYKPSLEDFGENQS
jgi:hypothetical protein